MAYEIPEACTSIGMREGGRVREGIRLAQKTTKSTTPKEHLGSTPNFARIKI